MALLYHSRVHEGPGRRGEVGNGDRQAIEHLLCGHGWVAFSRCLRTKCGGNHVRLALHCVAEKLIG